MSSGFSFGQKPNETPTFGQSAFGNPQFGSPAATTAQPQFGSPFGAKQPAPGGFQFSTPTTAPAFGSTFNMNTTTPQQSANPSTGNFGFTTTTTAPAPPFSLGGTSTGFAFSTPATTLQSTTGLFGTPASSTAPSFGTPATGLFGTTASTVPTTLATGFGRSTAMPANTGLSFGTTLPTAPAPKMTFGTSSPGGFSFGPATTTSSAPTMGLFGTPTSMPAVSTGPPAPKFSFGPTATSSAATPSLNFGATPATTLNFQPATTSLPQTSLFPTTGATIPPLTFSTPSTTAPTLGLSFRTPAPSTTGINFSAVPATATFGAATIAPTFSAASSVPASTLNFLAPASTAPTLGLAPTTRPSATTTAASTTLSFLGTSAPSAITGFSSATSTATASVAPTLSFGTTSAPVTLSFGATAVTTSAPTLSFGLTPATSVPPTSSLSGFFGTGPLKSTATATTTSTAVTGLGGTTLGGIPKSTDPTKPTTDDQNTIAPKDQVLPNELMQTVDNFKKFVKEQKSYSSEISRFSIKDLRKVEHDVDVINNCMHEVESQLRKNKAMANKLKMDTAKDLQHADMAQRTFDTPVGLQYENTAPFNYFLEISDNFESEMHDLKIHIENVGKYVRNSGVPTILSPEDLALGMRRLHESFVGLAGRLQSVHSQVELQKEQYLNLRKKMLNDYGNVFEKQRKESDALEILLEKLVKQQPTISSSPTPFTTLRSSQVQAVGQNNATTIAYTIPTTLGAPITTGFSIGSAPNMSLFGNATTNTPSIFNTSVSNSFQLQKPPVGNKRGKP